MNHLDTVNTIRALYESILPNLETNQGVMFPLEIDISNHGYEKDNDTHHPEWEGRCRKLVRVIIANHYNIFMSVHDFGRDELFAPLSPADFKNISNHSSCALVRAPFLL